MAAKRKSSAGPVTFETVRKLALALPGVEDGTSYGTPALKVKGKLLARLRDDRESVVFIVGFDNRDILMQANPGTFYITDHYKNYPSVLVKLARVTIDELRAVIDLAWHHVAPKRLLRDAGR